MWETLTKIVLTVAVVALTAGTLRWIWTHQIDLWATGEKWVRGAVEPDWIATRDPAKLYQDGRVVADVRGEVERDEHWVMFRRLVNVDGLDHAKVIQHGRSTLRIRRIGSITGMLSTGLEMLRNVWDDVECEVVE
jgi:hypothetical protein